MPNISDTQTYLVHFRELSAISVNVIFEGAVFSGMNMLFLLV